MKNIWNLYDSSSSLSRETYRNDHRIKIYTKPVQISNRAKEYSPFLSVPSGDDDVAVNLNISRYNYTAQRGKHEHTIQSHLDNLNRISIDSSVRTLSSLHRRVSTRNEKKGKYFARE